MPSSTLFLTTIAGTYIIIYVLVIIGIWRWRVNRRQEPPPVADRLLRGPGETLRQKLDGYDDALLTQILASVFLPPLFILLGIAAADIVPDGIGPWMLVVAALISAASLVYCAVKLLGALELRRNHYLGYFGERVVSEHLDILRSMGYHIYHDVPTGDAGSSSRNIDHVIVGPRGVFAIETKTRRKRASDTESIDNIIIFDGSKLVYPWGADEHGLSQAQTQAQWLEKQVQAWLGQRMPVTPVLVFPGWRVDERIQGNVRVTDPQKLTQLVLGDAPPTGGLTSDQITQVLRQLEVRCRDVEF